MSGRILGKELREIFYRIVARIGLNPLEAKRFAKFTVVGTFGALVDFGVYNVMLTLLGHTRIAESSMVPVVAGSVSFGLAVLSNFIWNRFWTYPDSREKPIGWQFVQFFAVNIVGISIRLPILRFAHEPFARLFMWAFPAASEIADRVGDNLALALAVGIVLFWNFFVNRYWTYNDVSSVMPMDSSSSLTR